MKLVKAWALVDNKTNVISRWDSQVLSVFFKRVTANDLCTYPDKVIRVEIREVKSKRVKK